MYATLVVFAHLLCAHAFTIKSFAGSSAKIRAQRWLHHHRNAEPDELASFKLQDPQGYALVNALLTKRSLGLLDPRKPTADFSSTSPGDTERAVGQAAFAKFSSPGELERHATSFPHHSSWLNWKAPKIGDVGILETVPRALSADELALNVRLADASAADELPSLRPSTSLSGRPVAASKFQSLWAAVTEDDPPPNRMALPSFNWANPYSGSEVSSHAPRSHEAGSPLRRSLSSSGSLSNPYLAGIDFLGGGAKSREAPRVPGALDYNEEIAKISVPDGPILRNAAPASQASPSPLGAVERKAVAATASLDLGDTTKALDGTLGPPSWEEQALPVIAPPQPEPVPTVDELDADLEAAHSALQPEVAQDLTMNKSKLDTSFAVKLQQDDIQNPEAEALGDWLSPEKLKAQQLLSEDGDTANPYLSDLHN